MIRFNEQGPDGLVNESSPGALGKLIDKHEAFLARLVEEGPIPAMSITRRDRASVGYSNVRIGIGLHRRGFPACERACEPHDDVTGVMRGVWGIKQTAAKVLLLPASAKATEGTPATNKR